MVTEVIYQPQYLTKTAIDDFRSRLEVLQQLFEETKLVDGRDVIVQSDFDPISRDFALAAGHKEALLNDVNRAGFLEIALLHCGGVVQVIDDIVEGRCTNAFATIPVGGHHAGPAGHWGFCYLNEVACAVHQLREHHGLHKILYVDQDFHHADGTEKFFRDDPEFFFIDTHGPQPGQRPGAVIDKAHTYVDLTLPKGLGGTDFHAVLTEALDFALNKCHFTPDILINYAGFDAHVLDGFNRGTLRVDYPSFIDLTTTLVKLAGHFCGGRLLCIGGGGYNAEVPDFSATCTFNAIAALAGKWDFLREHDAPRESSNPVARIKVNSLLKEFVRARF